MLRIASISRVAAAALLTASTLACDGLLDVEPTESVGPDIAAGTLEGVQALLTGVYNRLQHGDKYGADMMLEPEILADNGRPSDPPNQFVGEYLNQIGSHFETWDTRYQTINEANFVVASVDALDADASVKDQIKGEALFLRALTYFDLARMFAYEPNHIVGGWDVGLVLRTEPTLTAEDAAVKPRSTVLETYQLIESDLLQSIELTAAGTDNVYFANQAAAEALLARLYLYWERWEEAASYATRALEHTTAVLASASEYPSIFATQPNPESLFELNYDPATETLWVNDCAACFTHPAGTWFSVWPTDELLALFEPGDIRNQLFPSTADGIRYVNKYTESVGDNTDNMPIIRYSEVLLIRAEANAETGREDLARADLTRLRANRKVGPITASGEALTQATLDERRRELAFEGHRWFDLKRRGMDIPKPAASGNPPLPYTDFRILAPIPSTEVQNNPELQQNPGY